MSWLDKFFQTVASLTQGNGQTQTIGTTDAQAVVLQTNATARITISSAGALTIPQSATFQKPLYLPSYTVVGVPSASPANGLIMVSNESGGAVPAFSDGTNWRRVTDRAIIS